MLSYNSSVNILLRNRFLLSNPNETLQKLWNRSFFKFYIRTLSSIHTRFTNSKLAGGNVINKNYQNWKPLRCSYSSNSSKGRFDVVKFLFGASILAAYNANSDNESIFGIDFFAACECAADSFEIPPPPDVIKDCFEETENKCDNSKSSQAKAETINASLENNLKEVQSELEDALKIFRDEIILLYHCLKKYEKIRNYPFFDKSVLAGYTYLHQVGYKIKNTFEKGQKVGELMYRLRDLIENGKACKFTSCNIHLKNAEKALRCAEKEILFLEEKVMECEFWQSLGVTITFGRKLDWWSILLKIFSELATFGAGIAFASLWLWSR